MTSSSLTADGVKMLISKHIFTSASPTWNRQTRNRQQNFFFFQVSNYCFFKCRIFLWFFKVIDKFVKVIVIIKRVVQVQTSGTFDRLFYKKKKKTNDQARLLFLATCVALNPRSCQTGTLEFHIIRNLFSSLLLNWKPTTSDNDYSLLGGFSERTVRQNRSKNPQRSPWPDNDHNKYNKHIIVPRTNTAKYQNSVLQKSLRIIRDGYVNKYTHPRRIETTTAAYHVEIAAKRQKQIPKAKQLTTTSRSLSPTQCPLCVFKAKNAKGLTIHKGRMHK